MPIGYIYSLEEARTELIKLENSIRIATDRITLRDNRIEELEKRVKELEIEPFGYGKLLENVVTDYKQEIVYLNERMDALEAVHGEMFKLDLETLKERRDTLYDSLNDPISDNAKGRINIDILKIERLINIRMKEGNSNGKDTQETG